MREIEQGMQVLGSDGGMVGRVTGLHGDHIHVEPDAPEPGAADHIVPRRWVARVDEHVHLDREARLVRDTWRPNDEPAAVAGARRETAQDGADKGWILWLIGALMLLLVIILGVRGCVYATSDGDMTQPNVDAPDS